MKFLFSFVLVFSAFISKTEAQIIYCAPESSELKNYVAFSKMEQTESNFARRSKIEIILNHLTCIECGEPKTFEVTFCLGDNPKKCRCQPQCSVIHEFQTELECKNFCESLPLPPGGESSYEYGIPVDGLQEADYFAHMEAYGDAHIHCNGGLENAMVVPPPCSQKRLMYSFVEDNCVTAVREVECIPNPKFCEEPE